MRQIDESTAVSLVADWLSCPATSMVLEHSSSTVKDTQELWEAGIIPFSRRRHSKPLANPWPGHARAMEFHPPSPAPAQQPDHLSRVGIIRGLEYEPSKNMHLCGTPFTASRFSPNRRPGGHDLLLVTATVTMSGTWFLSCRLHSRQHPLASYRVGKIMNPRPARARKNRLASAA